MLSEQDQLIVTLVLFHPLPFAAVRLTNVTTGGVVSIIEPGSKMANGDKEATLAQIVFELVSSETVRSIQIPDSIWNNRMLCSFPNVTPV